MMENAHGYHFHPFPNSIESPPQWMLRSHNWTPLQMLSHKRTALLNRGAVIFILPSYDFINECLLLTCSTAQINAGGFDALVSHDVSKK